MFFILSKTIYYILMPQVWILLLLLYTIFTKHQRRRKKALIVTLLVFLIFTNNFLANESLLLWEKEPVPISSLAERQTAIVLTGVTNSKSSKDRVYFGRGADRVLHTIQLYKAGKVQKILISGGSGSLTGRDVPEADQLKKVFRYCGVPENDIVLENKSRNTHESALFSKKLIDSLGIKQRFLLITSAFHIRRSEGCFSKAGIFTTIYPVDYYTIDRKKTFTPDNLLIPSSDAMSKWAMLMHEITGYLTYKMMGYC